MTKTKAAGEINPVGRRYVVVRDCCTSGNCFRCKDVTPLGVPVRVEHADYDFLADADKMAAGWTGYGSAVYDRGPAMSLRPGVRVRRTETGSAHPEGVLVRPSSPKGRQWLVRLPDNTSAFWRRTDFNAIPKEG